MTPSPSNNLDWVYYNLKSTFRLETYLSELHRGPQRTTLVRFRLGQHWLYTRIGRFGPHRVLYDCRWCQYCALSAQCLVVDSEEHAIFHCPLHDNIRQQQPWAQHQDCCDLQAFMRLPSLQQARFLHACYECHLGLRCSPLCKGRDGGGVAYAGLGFVSTSQRVAPNLCLDSLRCTIICLYSLQIAHAHDLMVKV